VRIHSSSTTYRWYSPCLIGNYFTQSSGVKMLYTAGAQLIGNTFKDFTTTTTSSRTTAFQDGTTGAEATSNINFVSLNNVTFFTPGLVGTQITTILPTTLSHYDNRIQGSLHLGDDKAVDAPTQTHAVLYASRNGEVHLVARDSTNDVEAVIGSSSLGVVVGAKTSSEVGLMTAGANKVYLDANGRIYLAAAGSAAADADIVAADLGRTVTIWVDEGNSKVMFKVGYSDGTTFKSGEVALT